MALLLMIIAAFLSTEGPLAAPPAPPCTPTPPGVLATAAPAPGKVVRLRGDAAVVPALSGDGYVLPALGLRIEAPLPEDYPPPTPPEMIELKTYPVVRRAEYRAAGRTSIGMNLGFWPLFNHITKREIAMTSPVEMDYRTREGGEPLAAVAPTGSWTMSFLYRSRELGPTGADGRVVVVDAPAVTVVSVGILGPYGVDTTNRGVAELRAWFAKQSAWEPAGNPRALHYNGPSIPNDLRWSEVQMPVRATPPKPVQPAQANAPSTTPAIAPSPAAESPRPAAPATAAP